MLQVFVSNIHCPELITGENEGKILITEAADRGFEREGHIIIPLVSLQH